MSCYIQMARGQFLEWVITQSWKILGHSQRIKNVNYPLLHTKIWQAFTGLKGCLGSFKDTGLKLNILKNILNIPQQIAYTDWNMNDLKDFSVKTKECKTVLISLN